MICIDTWRGFTWTWLSCGGAQSRDAPCGRARHRTAWITFVAHMMFRGRLSRPAWRSTSLHGQLRGKCGQIRWRLSTQGFRLMCCCLATSTCRWCTTIESTSEVFCILLSGGTICLSCALCCHCQRSRQHLGWYRPTPPARVRCVQLGLRKSMSPEVMDRSPRTTRRAFRRR